MGRRFLAGAVVMLTVTAAGATAAQSVYAATTIETNAVNWAIGKIGSTSYGQLCLKLVTDAYQAGAGFNIESLTNFGSFNSDTYPQEVWDAGFKSGTTGGSNTTPPYGALVFFNASGPGANDPSDFSHVTVMASGGEMISTNDVVDENAVHYETMAQVQAHHPYNTYVGWWLPDGTPGGTGTGALALTSPLVISAPSGWYQFAPVDETFTVTNESGVPASIQRLILAVRDPFNAGYDQICAVALALQAGQSYTCTLSNPWGSSGQFTVWADWLDYNGNWHQGQLGPNQTFTLAAAPTLVATQPVVASAPSGWYQFAPVDEEFTVTNESGVPASIQRLVLAVRDPFNAGYDQICATGLTLLAGQSKSCTLSNPWGSSGQFIIWADWLDYNGNWHQGQLGPNQTFTLAPAPTLVASSPLTITAPSGYHQFAPINETFTVTNESGVPASIQRLVLAVRDPSNTGYDQICGVALALQAGQSRTCTLSHRWGSSGQFTVWADWLDYNGNWHQGQLGPNQTFTLAHADIVTTAALPVGTVSKHYAATLTALGGTLPYTWAVAAGALPKGLTLSSAGTISGTPASASQTNITIKVADSSTTALTATRTYRLTIGKARTTATLTLSTRKIAYGNERTERLSVTVAPQYPGTTPTGKITIKQSTTTLCIITLNRGHGTCRLTATQLRPGTYHLTAAYPGNHNFRRSTSSAKTLTITK